MFQNYFSLCFLIRVATIHLRNLVAVFVIWNKYKWDNWNYNFISLQLIYLIIRILCVNLLFNWHDKTSCIIFSSDRFWNQVNVWRHQHNKSLAGLWTVNYCCLLEAVEMSKCFWRDLFCEWSKEHLYFLYLLLLAFISQIVSKSETTLKIIIIVMYRMSLQVTKLKPYFEINLIDK